MVNKYTPTVLAKNMQRLMDERGLSKTELSFDSRIPYTRVAMILRGQTKDPQLSTVVKLAEALGVSIDTLAADPKSVDQKMSA